MDSRRQRMLADLREVAIAERWDRSTVIDRLGGDSAEAYGQHAPGLRYDLGSAPLWSSEGSRDNLIVHFTPDGRVDRLEVERSQ
jgi:hypothetical protein